VFKLAYRPQKYPLRVYKGGRLVKKEDTNYQVERTRTEFQEMVEIGLVFLGTGIALYAAGKLGLAILESFFSRS